MLWNQLALVLASEPCEHSGSAMAYQRVSSSSVWKPLPSNSQHEHSVTKGATPLFLPVTRFHHYRPKDNDRQDIQS